MNRRTVTLVSALIVVVVGAALAIGLSGNQSAASGCRASGIPKAYHVTIRNGDVSNDHISGRLCDTITITSNDTIVREIAFGPHEDHVPYDGVAERLLSKGQSFTITLNQAGSFRWHDHLHDEVQGYFTVSK